MSKIQTLIGGATAGRLARDISCAIALALALNLYIFIFSPRSALTPRAGYLIWAPEGWVVGAVWVGLFALMGWARWRLMSMGSDPARLAATWTTRLMLICAAYPIYTFGLTDEALGFAGNLATLAFAIFAARTSARVDFASAIAPGATAIWLIFATLLIADQNRWFW